MYWGMCIIYMGGCQKYGPFLGTLNIRGRIIIGIQQGIIILTTTHIYVEIYIYICMHGTGLGYVYMCSCS